MKDLFIRYEELKQLKSTLAEKGYFPGTSGNLSIRIDSECPTFLVTASGKDKNVTTAEDFILVDEQGLPRYEHTKRPSAETILHSHIYTHTNANVVIHVHTFENNLLSQRYENEGAVHLTKNELIKAFDLWEEDACMTIPIIKNHAHIPTLGAALLPYLTKDEGAVLIQNHGITLWAKDVFTAKKHLEAYEFLFKLQLSDSILGGKFYGNHLYSK